MRKISKSRGDDEVNQSNNGSVVNEEPAEQSNEKEDSDLMDSNEGQDEESEDTSKDNSKKNKVSKKSKGKKKKPVKNDAKAEAEEEYEVDKIVDSRKVKGKTQYLIRWKGYSASSDTWEPEHTLSCPDLIDKFKEEKENSKDKESEDEEVQKKSKKRKGKKTTPVPKKKKNTSWDGENADENAEYEVDRILEVHFKKDGKREFLIHWKGWSNKFDSWEPESHLNCPDLIKKFMDKVDSARTVDTRNLRVAPETTNRFTLQDPTSGRRLSKRRGQRQRVRYDNAE